MAFRPKHRLVCLLAAFLFALSSVAHVYAATDAAMNMPATAMQGMTSGDGMDCDGHGKIAHGTCVAMCATAFAILSEAAPFLLTVTRSDVVSAAEWTPSGRGFSPEPHPPKH